MLFIVLWVFVRKPDLCRSSLLPFLPLLDSQADHMEIYFHSDLSNNDWGVRLSAYGIMQVRDTRFTAAMPGG